MTIIFNPRATFLDDGIYKITLRRLKLYTGLIRITNKLDVFLVAAVL